jgi:transcriptional regulator with XRE-family HTH domain
MKSHAELIDTLMTRPGVRAEVERIEREEFALLDILLKARREAGLSQAQVAERMGTQAPAVARLERALATGQHSPSVATLRKYARACGKRLVLDLEAAPPDQGQDRQASGA